MCAQGRGRLTLKPGVSCDARLSPPEAFAEMPSSHGWRAIYRRPRPMTAADLLEEPTDATRRERILIVDDEERVRSLYAECLSERYQCVTAGDAQEALVRLAARLEEIRQLASLDQ